MFQKFVKTKQNKVKLFKILQDRSKTNVFVSNCVEEEKLKNETSFLWGKNAKKNEYNCSSTIEDLPLLPQIHKSRIISYSVSSYLLLM
jgi:nitrogen regulatory protein PII-like uncharacterized protein